MLNAAPLSQSVTPAASSALTDVPVIDISAYYDGTPEQRKVLGKQIDKVCQSLGFLVITGHNVPLELIRSTHAASRAFFDLPLATKKGYEPPNESIYRGYRGLNGATLAYSIDDAEALPDFRELYTINRFEIDDDDPYFATPQAKRIFSPNIWPSEIPGVKETWQAYYKAMEELATALMRLFALGLDLDERWFDDKIDKHMTNFCLSNYPDQPEALPKGQMRGGPHTDFGSLTILHTEDRPGGLEVQMADGEWRKVPIMPGAFIINLGDLMAQWTNDRWVSTMHRVVNPPRDQAIGSRRQSLIFFHQPNYDARIECLPSCLAGGTPKYAPTTSGEHLLMKMQKTYEKPMADAGT